MTITTGYTARRTVSGNPRACPTGGPERTPPNGHRTQDSGALATERACGSRVWWRCRRSGVPGQPSTRQNCLNTASCSRYGKRYVASAGASDVAVWVARPTPARATAAAMVAMSLRIRSSFEVAMTARSEPPPGRMAKATTLAPNEGSGFTNAPVFDATSERRALSSSTPNCRLRTGSRTRESRRYRRPDTT